MKRVFLGVALASLALASCELYSYGKLGGVTRSPGQSMRSNWSSVERREEKDFVSVYREN
jgi:hypothetical protein